jgi:hypothetical protein
VSPIVTNVEGLDHARSLVRRENLVRPGAVVVFVSIGPDLANDGGSNFVHAETV